MKTTNILQELDSCPKNDEKKMENKSKKFAPSDADWKEWQRKLQNTLIQANEDNVNHPSYYCGKIEVIDFIDDKNLDFCLGNAVKYIARAGKKDPSKTIEDLEKAQWYIAHEIMKLRNGIVTERDISGKPIAGRYPFVRYPCNAVKK